MRCPRCSTESNSKTCPKCGLNLIIPCPACKTLNPIGKRNCTKCNAELFLTCPKCKTINALYSKKCRKCGENIIQEQQTENKKYAVICVELINFKAIQAKIKNKDAVLKIQKLFYQIIAKHAKGENLLAKKISEQDMIIEFENYENTVQSATKAIITAQNILKEIIDLNFKIQKNLHVQLKARIGICISDAVSKYYFCKNEKSAAIAGNIVVSQEVFDITNSVFDFTKTTSTNAENEQINFYILNEFENVEEKLNNITTPEEPEIIQETFNIPETSRQHFLNSIVEHMKNSKKSCLINLCGDEGIGKSYFIESIKHILGEEEYIWLLGNCYLTERNTPFAFFRDLFKNLFGLPIYTINIEDDKKIINKFFENILKIKDKQIINSFYSLLLNEIVEDSDFFENRKNLYDAIKAVLTLVSSSGNLIFIVEDIEYIDKSSLDLIKFLMNKSLLPDGVHFIISSNSQIDVKNIFSKTLKEEDIKIFKIENLNPEEMEFFLKQLLKGEHIIPTKIKEKIFSNSNGNPLYIEHIIRLLIEVNALFYEENKYKFNLKASKIELPASLDELLTYRLYLTNKENPEASNILTYSSMLGQKFMPYLLMSCVRLEAESISEQLNTLIDKGFLINADEYHIIFKHKALWDKVYNQSFANDELKIYHGHVFNALEAEFKINSAIIANHAQIAGFNKKALEYYDKAAKEAFSLGDINSFTIAQQKVLSLIDDVIIGEDIEKETFKTNIYEQIGKINYKENPSEALNYLSNAILNNEKIENKVKVIELTGYLAKSCDILGNYSGVIECVDKALLHINKNDSPLEYALLCNSKLKALINMGRLEEVKITAQTDVLPILKEALHKKQTVSGLNLDDIEYILLKSELHLAKALALQGNKNIKKITSDLYKKVDEINREDIKAEIEFIDAIYDALQGNTKSIGHTLDYLKEQAFIFKSDINIKLNWGVLSIIQNLLKEDLNQAKTLIDVTLSLADTGNDYNIQTLLRLLQGWIYQKEDDFKQAKSVYNELVIYASDNKLASAALLGWFLIAQVEIKTDPERAKSIILNALDITQKPFINNSLMIILLQKLLAEVYMVKGDFDSALMYIEKSIKQTEEMDLTYLTTILYSVYGHIFQEKATVIETNKQENAYKAYEFYIKAIDVAQKIENENLITKIEKDLTNLSTFCQLSGIEL